MLTHAENISIHFSPHFFSKKGHIQFTVGRHTYDWKGMRLTREEYYSFLNERDTSPFKFNVENKTYWLFENKFYKDTDGLDHDSVKALLLSRQRLKQEHINRAKSITAAPKIESRPKRGILPEDIKLLVWQRDEGRCAKCGSQSELQYDHIIPISLGGSSTPENLQILCGKCNRTKRTSVS